MNMKLGSLVLALFLSLSSLHAEASKRLGGGKSVGQQSNNVTQREAAKPAPAGAPAQNAAPAPAAAPTPAPAPASAVGGGTGISVPVFTLEPVEVCAFAVPVGGKCWATSSAVRSPVCSSRPGVPASPAGD